ncbi:vesicle trafficking 1 [Nomia melanderi]|uniref:vesicle trafficking 1 n=1 Tax=Nomia melanderi TaxID=2448451 RepID=UPI0013044502|nr:vacuolar protein sorting-associated protein VTA1 homolog [Nomia melanderi]XP_031844115.1 vacuolar protein sorting-associated protein VTA1 homolog [Nomia melanderi]XP_031844116.1 vacuolar protein sorting-associated protein VTA1 homolog [Nomia melanderi]XP_031844117.1 vacuolar protein sorting-associated protein VTA1 homolog [Nomia melanderi]
MVNLDLPEIPPSLKSIQQYLKIAATHDQRDLVVSYWCRLYALQTGLKLSTKTVKETNFLLKLMHWLETTKQESRENEAITNDVAAQAHLENWALKLFLYADKNDRAGNFNKSIVQSFYIVGLLYDVLTVFGELSEEATQNRKYARWKATYIHNCLKNGEIPIPGPIEDGAKHIDSGDNSMDKDTDDVSDSGKVDEGEAFVDSNRKNNVHDTDSFDRTNSMRNEGDIGQQPSEMKDDYRPSTETEGGVDLSLDQMNKAQKFIKWAGSALNYDDVPTAVLNLRKALNLLTVGKEEE